MGGALAVPGVLGAHVLGNGGQGVHKGVVVGALGLDGHVARQPRRQDEEGIVGGRVQVHAHLVVGAGHHLAQGLLQHGGADGGVGGVKGQHGGHIGCDHPAALADGPQGAGHAPQLEADGVLLGVGVGGHDGGGGVGAALGGVGQFGRRRRDARGKGVDGHGLADDAGGGGQDVPGRDAQGLAGQAAAFLSQVHPVGGAGVGVAAVDQDGLGIAVGQMGPVHLDGCAADLVGGVDPPPPRSGRRP